jgi:hypothetical protein
VSGEGSLTDYLGIHFETRPNGTIQATQTGLIDKIISATGLLDCKTSDMPTSQVPLGHDADGESYSEDWHYASLVGMLQYLQQHTRPEEQKY